MSLVSSTSKTEAGRGLFATISSSLASYPTLDRFIAVSFLKNFGVSLVSLVALFLFQQLLGDMYDHLYPTEQILIHNLLFLPDFAVKVTPPAVAAATVLTLSNLAKTHELTACFAIGISLKRIVALILSLVFIICCVVLMMEDRVLPPTYKKRTTYYYRVMEKKQDFFLDIKQDKIWYRSKNMIYNLQRFDPKTHAIRGMSVYEFDSDFNLAQVVDATGADFTPNGWKLQDGTVTLFTSDDPFPKTQKFKEKDLQISETPKDFQEIEKEVDGLRLKELSQYIKRVKEAGADTKSYEVNFHSRISLSFIPIVMCILGVPFSTRGRREGGGAIGLVYALVLTFFYWIFYSIGLSLGTNGSLPPWLAAWLPSMIFGALAVVLLARQKA